MIKVSNVSKSFEDLTALHNVSLNIRRGSLYGLVGSNGAGKTTMLKLLAGIYSQDEGEILIEEEKVFENNRVKGKIAFIADDLYFFSQYSVRAMARFYRDIYPTWSEERFQKLKEVFNIDLKKPISRLSKGMQRQVAFWLALSLMPEIIILDEPLDGLDPVMRQKVKNLLIQDVAEREVTIIISSHNLRDLEDICDHVGILHKGALVLEKELDELKTDIHKIQVAFPDETPEQLLNHPEIVYKEERGSVTLFIIRGDKKEVAERFAGFKPVILDILPLTLEEIFVYEMGEAGYEIRNVLY